MSRSGSAKIMIYALNYADRILEEVPYLRYSAERSLCFLRDLRDPAVRMVVVTSEPVDPYTLEYHFRDVLRFDDPLIESARARLTLLTPRSHLSRPLDELVLGDDRVMDVLRSTARESEATTIAHFMASPSLERLAGEIGAGLEEGGHSFVARWGTKAGGKEILRRAGVPVPDGPTDVLHSEAEVARAAVRLAAGGRRPRRVLVKLNANTWTASIGNVLVDSAELRRTGDVVGSADVIRIPPDDLRRELAGDGAVVEEFVEEITSSPSGLGRVGPDGTVTVLACHDQVLDRGQYWGCRFPAADEWRPAIMDAVTRTGEVLARMGHRGTFGVDFVVSGERGPLAVEINLRKVGTSHVLEYAEALVDGRVGDDGLLRRDGRQPVSYVNGRLLAPEVLRGIEPREAVERLRQEGLLYRRDTGRGVALHVLGALRTCGYVELTALGPTPEDAEACYKAAEAALTRTEEPDS